MSGLSVSSSETSPTLAAIVEEIGADLPDCHEKTSPDGMLTIVFTDIEGSTEMMERLGEERWLEVMFTHNRMVRDCVVQHGGEVIKSQGDGFMVTFASASAALDCGIELQRILGRYNAATLAESLHVRVGMHTGSVFEAEQDFLGKAVVLAARITGCARGGEVLVSAASREYTERVGRWRYGEPRDLTLKGLATIERAYPLVWSQ